MTPSLRVAVLGSTGSIGRQTLQVAAAHADRIAVVALAANSSADLVAEQARAFGVKRVALSDDAAAARALSAVGEGVLVESGPDAVVRLAELDDVDIVLNALVGAAGLRATAAALRAGKTLALANKESLVVGGEFITAMAAPGQILPVDSEHSAIFQCYLGENADDVTRITMFEGRELMATAPELTRNHMEVRGIGIIDVAKVFGIGSIRVEKRLDLVVTLKDWGDVEEVDRIGLDRQFYEILGFKVPHVTIPVRPGRDMARLIEVAAMDEKLKGLGQHAAVDFNSRLLRLMEHSASRGAGAPGTRAR